MGKEIERKFLLECDPPVAYTRELHLVQAYLQLDPEVRIRSDGIRYWMMKKAGAGLVREEIAQELNAEEFDSLLGQARWRIEKVRRIAIEGGRVLEMDEFIGALSGLNIIEVEFLSAEEAEAFVPLAWFGREVTYDQKFKCAFLAVNGLPAGINTRKLIYSGRAVLI
jgi:adenylate cyclase